MSDAYLPKHHPSGAVLQGGIPLRRPDGTERGAFGLLVRGVVTATYVLDDGSHPMATDDPVAVYCDVFVYSNVPGMRFRMLQKVAVGQDRGGIHSGRVWKPRAATIDVTGSALNLGRATNPANIDGDHVIVGFLDNSYTMPIILGGIPHPIADAGNEAKDAGHRRRLKLADGDPDFWKHKGAFYGVDKDGNFVIDTTEAYAADALESDGREPAVAGDGSTGNVIAKLPEGAKVTILVNATPCLELDLSGPDAKLTLGDGVKSGVIGEALQTFWNNTVKPALDNWGGASGHAHPTGMGPSGPPSTPLNTPSFDAAILSTKLKFPDA